jgi:hypothetical protein
MTVNGTVVGPTDIAMHADEAMMLKVALSWNFFPLLRMRLGRPFVCEGFHLAED